MTPETVTEQEILGALARVRARWDRPPLDRADVAERAAVRLGDDCLDMLVLQARCACRVFVRRGEGSPWVSRYVHTLDEVDPVLDHLLGRIAARSAA